MREVICNTSPLQYLHQLERLQLLRALAGRLIVPPAVVQELSAGAAKGLNLPDVSTLPWVEVRPPRSSTAIPLVTDLGAGETEVLAVALETTGALVLLDDSLARRVAAMLGVPVKGTLGLILEAKRAGLVTSVRDEIDKLEDLGFRLDPATRTAVLRIAGES